MSAGAAARPAATKDPDPTAAGDGCAVPTAAGRDGSPAPIVLFHDPRTMNPSP